MRPGTAESAYASWVLVQLGDTAAAREELLGLENASRLGYVSADGLAAIYALLGDKTRALESLAQAERDTAFTLPFLTTMVSFDSLRNTPRFQALIRRMGVVALN